MDADSSYSYSFVALFEYAATVVLIVTKAGSVYGLILSVVG